MQNARDKCATFLHRSGTFLHGFVRRPCRAKFTPGLRSISSRSGSSSIPLPASPRRLASVSYLHPRPTQSRSRRMEIIPRTGLGRRGGKTRTCCRRAGLRKSHGASLSSWSWSGSGSGSTVSLSLACSLACSLSPLLLLQHRPVYLGEAVRRAEQCSAPHRRQTHRRLREGWRSQEEGGGGGGGERRGVRVGG